ncbi:hypothetical protein AB0467_34540 [Streptomyces sp. NPDC052095]|uniref:hypothetical protein n=1 Tax=unclassified Streptomyces TaxID=2593676 RepID=UPI00344BEA92
MRMRKMALATVGTALALGGGLATAGPASAAQNGSAAFTIMATCGQSHDVTIPGGEPHYTVDCGPTTTRISGTLTDIKADGMSVPSSSMPSAATEDVTWLDFKYSSWSHWTPDSKDSSHAGTLNAGRNYVYCWQEGETYTDKGHTSGNWLLTDDDSGNSNVWVSRVYLADSSYNAPLRHC